MRSLLTRRTLAPLLLALVVVSCATTGGPPPPPQMPAARAALRPEFRIFYDALQDYGDWVLIEPYGFVFRPRVDFATFRPYSDGFWAPSDPWGWVWISAEPFGWATYHYGSWFWDSFQGWVWTPGIEWGPAWVDWQLAGNYAGWAPSGPIAGNIPGGAYLYAPVDRLGSTDLHSSMKTGAALGSVTAQAHPVENVIERDGVRFNAGPAFALVERARGGPLQKVRIEEAAGSPGAPSRKEPAASPAQPAPASASAGSPDAPIQAARAAASTATREARALMQRGGNAPPKVQVVHAPLKASEPPATAAKNPPAPKGASADSTR